MDNVCHSLAGAVIAQAGFARRVPRATLLCVIGANIPDVDAITYVVGGPLSALGIRRGWTHGIPALIVWSLVLSAGFWWWNRLTLKPTPDEESRQVPFLLGAAFVSVFSHTSLDWLNTYGVRWFMPFSRTWYYGDTLFIVDVVLVVLFAVGVWWSRQRLRRRHRRAEWPARTAIATALLYIAAMKGMSELTRQEAVGRLRLANVSARTLMVAPRPVSVFQRDVLVRQDSAYRDYDGHMTWRGAELGALLSETPVRDQDPASRAAARAPGGKVFLGWSRFPYFVPDIDGDITKVFIGDARYTRGTENSWASTLVNLRRRRLPIRPDSTP